MDQLVTVGACAQLLMAVVGWWGRDGGGMNAGQSQVGWSHVGRCQSTFRL